MATVCLDYQNSYTRPTTADLELTSRGLLAQNPPFSAVSGNPLHLPPPPELYNAGGSQLGGTRTPKNDGIKMSAGDESDHTPLTRAGLDIGGLQPSSTRIPVNDVIEISIDEESDDDALGLHRRKDDEDGPVVPSQIQESRASTPLLRGDESIIDLELADTEPPLRSQSPRSASSNCGVETQQTFASRPLSQGHEHQDDSSQMSDRTQRDPLVPGDTKKQDEEGRTVVSPQAQESAAGIPRLSHDESNNDCELAGAEQSVQSSMQPSASQARPIPQHLIGRRRLCDADDGKDSCPTVDSDAEHSEKDDVVGPPCRKRRKVSTVTVATGRTASQRQTRPDYGDSSSREARRSSWRPKRQGKRGAAHPLSP
ncbi:uncharacterized protein C8A04DRAFT_31178 [Dichotomopilus funicola]|uniref:Uncharacterized protein n=1 Tax=Dichotomopilus funicola TaxID=1934379 RepID=A0AAN6UY67_9PEZI|nr:hypothetical protein C8A04DRAFT_31178 [Dichotomopilus funicola]